MAVRLDRRVVFPGLTGGRIDAQMAEKRGLAARRYPRPPRPRRRIALTRATSSRGAEGLGQVVVCANRQTDHLVRLIGARRQQQDVDVGLLAQAAQHFEAVDAGQHDVQHHQVRREAARQPQRRRTVHCRLDHVALALEVGPDVADDAGLVVHYQDFGFAHRFPRSVLSALNDKRSHAL